MWLLIFLIVFLFVYQYTTRNHNYWRRKKVKHETPIPVFGNHFRNVFGYSSATTISEQLYNKYPQEKIVGYYQGNIPVLYIRDPDLVRQILNVDFNYFYARGLGRDPKMEPINLNLFHVDGDYWKLLRQRLSPAFTSSKLKAMFPLVVRCAEKLQGLAKTVATGGEEYDVRELMARYTTEFIGSCVFGIEMDTINTHSSQFRKLGRKIFTPLLHRFFLKFLLILFPEFTTKMYNMGKEYLDDIHDLVAKILKHKQGQPFGRNDFIDMLLKLMEQGKIVGESIERKNPDGTSVPIEMEFDMTVVVAQVFIFFAAGFETSSSATSFTLHQLAYNPDIQREIQQEIDTVLEGYGNKLCYEAVEKMTLLDIAFKEAMRIFPSLGCLNRSCTNKYTIPGTGVTIDSGVKIVIPIQAIQRDAQYFDSPMEFRPRRFTPEAMEKWHKYVYLPFGAGPRACIGSRLGAMQSLAGLAALLQKFSFEPSPSSTKQLELNHWSNTTQGVRNGIKLRIRIREDVEKE